ncbi:MAG: cyclic pyranopterin monophosphate synthase MoaC [Chloroflexi bacterium]|nr:cyclic pyranopterin monophosphate synthase MoaC [Chloroflexota bacterium]
MIELYIDGAHDPVTDRGAWAAVMVEDRRRQVFSGTVEKTTSQRMEITAALEGISRLPPGAELKVYTDSQYVFGCATKNWRRRANRDLWEKLDQAAGERQVHWEWIDQTVTNPYQKEAHTAATGLVSGKAPEEPPAALTHIDESGRPRMVDVGGKPATEREAVARGRVVMQPATLELIKQGQISKGDVLTTARIAGIMAAKQTPFLIPLCHPILINQAQVELRLDEAGSAVEITGTVRCTGRTGVEMEAMTAVAVAALTIYDMCKAVERGIRIESIRLVKKSGGKSGAVSLEPG